MASESCLNYHMKYCRGNTIQMPLCKSMQAESWALQSIQYIRLSMSQDHNLSFANNASTDVILNELVGNKKVR